jgi:hypothetical protein
LAAGYRGVDRADEPRAVGHQELQLGNRERVPPEDVEEQCLHLAVGGRTIAAFVEDRTQDTGAVAAGTPESLQHLAKVRERDELTAEGVVDRHLDGEPPAYRAEREQGPRYG